MLKSGRNVVVMNVLLQVALAVAIVLMKIVTIYGL